MAKRLYVITGPTGVGKTDFAISLASHLHTEIISADSRQIYRGIPICTAAPTAAQKAAVPHHFVEMLELDQYYSAAQFEVDALACISQLHSTHDDVVMCGGSMMYVDAVCRGIDNIPTISTLVREAVAAKLASEGIDSIRAELHALDPEYYAIADLNNTKRLVHAVEICREAGTTYSSLRSGTVKERPFEIIKIGLTLPREEIFARIGARVDAMVAQGLEQEARSVIHLRHLNSLNTVGMKEMFSYFDGIMDRTTAIERIKKNTRVYAKKQLTWLKRKDDVIYLDATDTNLLNRALDIINS